MNKTVMTGKFKIILLLLILLIARQAVIAQKKVQVKASGSYVSLDLTPEQTREKALEEAKRDALIKAGVGESITVSDFLYTFEDNEKFQEIFQAFTSTETGGEVIIDNILAENRSFNEFGNMVIEVEIEATVFVHEDKDDPTLNIKVEGIEENYKNNSSLKFTVTPSTDGYLKIFNVTDEVSSILFPYQDESLPYLNDDPKMELKTLKKTTFPINKALSDGYTLEISNPAKNKEFNLLIFVFTRENIPFMEDGSDVKKIMEWIYSIPLDKRKVIQVGFVITR
jgi:hypothetical protein